MRLNAKELNPDLFAKPEGKGYIRAAILGAVAGVLLALAI
jgi:hypothetical protein